MHDIVIRIAGDSGDGIQALGTQFTINCQRHGLKTHVMPDFPAEIRAPSGSLFGVSAYQLAISETQVLTSGDNVDVLIAFNEAALEVNKANISPNTIVFSDSDASIPITKLTMEAVKDIKLQHSKKNRCKNMFVLGLICYLFNLELIGIINWIKAKFKVNEVIAANTIALRAGFNYADNVELLPKYAFETTTNNQAAEIKLLTGNQALAKALLAVAKSLKKSVFMAGYPITPASDILHSLAKHHNGKNINVIQAEDEIAAISMSIGAAFTGAIALTATSGPGFDLKAESLGFAIMAEIPLVIVNVQRAGPATGMPTKPEQSDLAMAVNGRHGESQTVVLAAVNAKDCYQIIFDAYSIAINYMLPVIVLTDAVLANSLCDLNNENYSFDLAKFKHKFHTHNWVTPGTKNKQFRLGSLERDFDTGNISSDAANHAKMTKYRADKLDNLTKHKNYNELNLIGENSGEILVITWGSNHGAVLTAVSNLQEQGYSISMLQVRFLYPVAKSLLELLVKFNRVITIELNRGQYNEILRQKSCINIEKITKVTGQPFNVAEIEDKLLQYLDINNARVIEKRL